jgi:hypothetical protein
MIYVVTWSKLTWIWPHPWSLVLGAKLYKIIPTIMLLKGAQNLLNVLQILFPSFVEYEDIIQIYNHKIICEWPQYIFHYPHELFWCINQAKRLDQPPKNFPSLDLKVIFHTLVFSIGTW